MTQGVILLTRLTVILNLRRLLHYGLIKLTRLLCLGPGPGRPGLKSWHTRILVCPLVGSTCSSECTREVATGRNKLACLTLLWETWRVKRLCGTLLLHLCLCSMCMVCGLTGRSYLLLEILSDLILIRLFSLCLPKKRCKTTLFTGEW